MNTSRRALKIVCLSLSLLLLIVVRFELKSNAAAVGKTVALVPVPSAFDDKARPSLTRRSLRRSSQTQSAAPTAKEKTIGETHKNIKVLNDLPDSKLIPMMNLIAGSLGVKCVFCHVNKNGQWDYPLDDKPEKNTAREMLAMTMNINKTTFKGNVEVSCYTCHRGRTHPLSLLELPIPEPTPRPSAGTTTGTLAAQPTVDEILNKYTAAIGGQAAIDKLKTRVMKGTYTLANGATGTYEATQTAPDKFYVARSLQQGNAEQGFNGAEGWQKDGRGVSDFQPDQLADVKLEYQFFRDLKFKDQYTRMSVRRDKINGRDVFGITAVRPDKKRERLYFDAESGLLLRRMGYTDTPLGVVPDQTDFEDYRDVDGVKVPFTVKIYVVGGFSTATRRFTEIKFNVPVEDSRFNKP